MSKLTEMLETPVEALTPDEWIRQLTLFYDDEAMAKLIAEHLLEEALAENAEDHD